MENSITIIGNLTKDPDLHYTTAGAAVCNFSIAINRRVKDANGNWTDGDPTYVDVNCWNHLAEGVAEGLRKGQRAVITGRIRQASWDTPQGKRTKIEVDADDVGPSLRFAAVRKPVEQPLDA